MNEKKFSRDSSLEKKDKKVSFSLLNGKSFQELQNVRIDKEKRFEEFLLFKQTSIKTALYNKSLNERPPCFLENNNKIIKKENLNEVISGLENNFDKYLENDGINLKNVDISKKYDLDLSQNSSQKNDKKESTNEANKFNSNQTEYGHNNSRKNSEQSNPVSIRSEISGQSKKDINLAKIKSIGDKLNEDFNIKGLLDKIDLNLKESMDNTSRKNLEEISMKTSNFNYDVIEEPLIEKKLTKKESKIAGNLEEKFDERISENQFLKKKSSNINSFVDPSREKVYEKNLSNKNIYNMNELSQDRNKDHEIAEKQIINETYVPVQEIVNNNTMQVSKDFDYQIEKKNSQINNVEITQNIQNSEENGENFIENNDNENEVNNEEIPKVFESFSDEAFIKIKSKLKKSQTVISKSNFNKEKILRRLETTGGTIVNHEKDKNQEFQYKDQPKLMNKLSVDINYQKNEEKLISQRNINLEESLRRREKEIMNKNSRNEASKKFIVCLETAFSRFNSLSNQLFFQCLFDEKQKELKNLNFIFSQRISRDICSFFFKTRLSRRKKIISEWIKMKEERRISQNIKNVFFEIKKFSRAQKLWINKIRNEFNQSLKWKVVDNWKIYVNYKKIKRYFLNKLVSKVFYSLKLNTKNSKLTNFTNERLSGEYFSMKSKKKIFDSLKKIVFDFKKKKKDQLDRLTSNDKSSQFINLRISQNTQIKNKITDKGETIIRSTKSNIKIV